MVESIHGAGPVQGITTGGKEPLKNKQEAKERDELSGSEPVDRVEISKEALSLAQAEESAEEARDALREDQTQTLSNDEERLDDLA